MGYNFVADSCWKRKKPYIVTFNHKTTLVLLKLHPGIFLFLITQKHSNESYSNRYPPPQKKNYVVRNIKENYSKKERTGRQHWRIHVLKSEGVRCQEIWGTEVPHRGPGAEPW